MFILVFSLTFFSRFYDNDYQDREQHAGPQVCFLPLISLLRSSVCNMLIFFAQERSMEAQT